jgi:hypothetical protein
MAWQDIKLTCKKTGSTLCMICFTIEDKYGKHERISLAQNGFWMNRHMDIKEATAGKNNMIATGNFIVEDFFDRENITHETSGITMGRMG